ncbi:uncharacterized protein EV422DRAFT_540120 [Fimicolochytrium jonesii]|uniref:uncharacterized protein n=1 Tax=Fimicolochytrium jonesii TaxID=1396493 RepID=UPI0022FF0190|nr:uncharacterized protein EV422DRAFT_540120 [Fimicolochytrium jonesii]KAI8817826.1 hypothetical protein EV422DRAFT_540120 [Fimicolochytrium jonesii]
MESEDAALAVLLSIFDSPTHSEAKLLSALRKCNGDVQNTIEALLSEDTKSVEEQQKQASGRPGSTGKSKRPASISQFFVPYGREPAKKPRVADELGAPASPDELCSVEVESSDTPASSAAPVSPQTPKVPLRNAFDLLSAKNADNGLKTAPITLNKDNVAQHVPCELFHDVLPDGLANALLVKLMDEATTWRNRRFVLFDREVESPHLTSFYTTPPLSTATDSAPYGIPDTDFYYGGKKTTDVRHIFPEMAEARKIIAQRVNERMLARDRGEAPGGPRQKMEVQGEWDSNIVVANCYKGIADGVGAHTDRLTYIGPRPTIGSLTLGATRPFRLRRLAIPTSSTSQPTSTPPPQTYNIPLPHNSLLIMHPPTQESYRHSIPKLTNPLHLIPHPISGSTRINLTFRVARDEYRAKEAIPVCKCGNPAELRVVLKRESSLGRYFYMCAGGGNEGKGVKPGVNCGLFEWLDLERVERRRRRMREIGGERSGWDGVRGGPEARGESGTAIDGDIGEALDIHPDEMPPLQAKLDQVQEQGVDDDDEYENE